MHSKRHKFMFTNVLGKFPYPSFIIYSGGTLRNINNPAFHHDWADLSLIITIQLWAHTPKKIKTAVVQNVQSANITHTRTPTAEPAANQIGTVVFKIKHTSYNRHRLVRLCDATHGAWGQQRGKVHFHVSKRMH